MTNTDSSIMTRCSSWEKSDTCCGHVVDVMAWFLQAALLESNPQHGYNSLYRDENGCYYCPFVNATVLVSLSAHRIILRSNHCQIGLLDIRAVKPTHKLKGTRHKILGLIRSTRSHDLKFGTSGFLGFTLVRISSLCLAAFARRLPRFKPRHRREA